MSDLLLCDELVQLTNQLIAIPSTADQPDQLQAAQMAMRNLKTAARADLARLAQQHATPADAGAVGAGLRAVLARYEAWLARLSPP